MSTTAALWLASVFGLAVLSLGRPAYGFALYLLCFFAHPLFWWWGRDLPETWEWSFYAGCVFLLSVVIQAAKGISGPKDTETTVICGLALAMIVNATVVHLLLAPNYSVSAESYGLLAKFVLLFFMIVASARTDRDYRLLLWSIVLGATYIGYEVTINDRGSFSSGRLEGAGVPGAKMANNLASLFVTVLPLVGGLFFVGKKWEKVLAAICAPLILNVVLLCNSRGAFLGMAVAAVGFLGAVPRNARKQAISGLALAGLATFLLLGDPDIARRFQTIFVSSEQDLDNSAQSRLTYWAAGVRMIADHPLGAGGAGFKKVYAIRYLGPANVNEARSVHNGFLNEAAEWGLQGLALRLLFIGAAVGLMLRMARYRTAQQDPHGAVMCAALIGSLLAFLITCMFGDFLDAEWGYWIIALVVAYARLYGPGAQEQVVTTAVHRSPVFAGGQAAPAVARHGLVGEVPKSHG